MEEERIALANLNALLLGLLLVGVAVHRRNRICRSFAVYVLTVVVCNRLILMWPDTFYTSSFWRFKESLYWILKLAVAAEIGLLTFSELPRARRQLLVLLVAILVLAGLAQLAPASPRPGDGFDWVSIASPRGQAGLVCLLAAVVAMAVRYRVPLHPFHRAILLGFGLYLVAYTGALALLRELGSPAAYALFNLLDPAAYAASVGVWAWAAWRPAEAPSLAVQRLHPWAR